MGSKLLENLKNLTDETETVNELIHLLGKTEIDTKKVAELIIKLSNDKQNNEEN